MRHLNTLAALTVLWLATSAAQATDLVINPKERIDFWLKNYTALNAENDPRVARAQTIFDRLLQAAGRRPGVEPRLHVIEEDPANLALPIALPDGSIILSRHVLDLCYRAPTKGDDRLAFVLAHELAHQLEDDFWHMKFFQAIEASRGREGASDEVLSELRDVVSLSDKVLSKELRADEMGIVYVAMAGFDAGAIADPRDDSHFFQEWITALDPSRIPALAASTHPSPEQRLEAVRTRLRQIADQTTLFDLGLLLYESGDFHRAALAFQEFRRHFPAREVNHNLAASYHQLALRHYRPTPNDLPFRLPLAIDPISRGGGSIFRSPIEDTKYFEQEITKAIELYRIVLSQDSSYLPAYRNLAAAHLLNHEPFKAIATLEDALKIAPNDAEVHNALAVALFLANNGERARAHFARAQALQPNYPDPWFNNAIISLQEGNQRSALSQAEKYLALDSASDWAQLLRKRCGLADRARDRVIPGSLNAENLNGVEIGAYTDEAPKNWGAPLTKTFALEETPYRVSIYPQGILAAGQGDEIRLMSTLAQYKGSTLRGIKLGSSRDELLGRYGMPTRELQTTRGATLLYAREGISFRMQQGHVESWLLFWD